MPRQWRRSTSTGSVHQLLTAVVLFLRLGVVVVVMGDVPPSHSHLLWQRWVSVYVFAFVSWIYFFIQLSLIGLSIARLTCFAGGEIKWNPTARTKADAMKKDALT